MAFMEGVRGRVRGKGARIVYPEALEERALRAAALLRDQNLARPILVGPEAEVRDRARAAGVDLGGIEVRDPERDAEAPAYAKTSPPSRGTGRSWPMVPMAT